MDLDLPPALSCENHERCGNQGNPGVGGCWLFLKLYGN